MKSINFEFLRERWPELASLGGFAEQYAASDPASAMVKLRLFVESMIQRIYDEEGLPRLLSTSLFDLLATEEFKKAVPAVVINVFHTIRKVGNRAIHYRRPAFQANDPPGKFYYFLSDVSIQFTF